MSNAKKIEPFINVGAGELIRDEIEYRKWTVEEFARRLDLSVDMTEKILNNEIAYTEDIANRIGNAFEVSPNMWLKWDKEYWERKNRENKAIKIKPVYKSAKSQNIKEM